MFSHFFSEMRPRARASLMFFLGTQKQEDQQLVPCQLELEATLILTSDFAYHKLSKENKDDLHGQSHKNIGKLARIWAATEATSQFQQMAYTAFSISEKYILSQWLLIKTQGQASSKYPILWKHTRGILARNLANRWVKLNHCRSVKGV